MLTSFSNPPYGLEVTHSLVDTINENNLEQLLGEPTRGANTLDLLFSWHSGFISNIRTRVIASYLEYLITWLLLSHLT